MSFDSKKVRAAQLLAEGRLQIQVADELQINARTIQRWMADPEFAEELEQRRQELLEAEKQLHLEKISKHRQDCETIGRSLVVAGSGCLGILNKRIERIDPDEIKLSDLGVLSRAASASLELGTRLLSDSLAIEKLLSTLEE